MNTLEKSKTDWEGWKGGGGGQADADAAATALTDREREEMEAQTKDGGGDRGGSGMAGYLGRRDFLERVRDRTGGV